MRRTLPAVILALVFLFPSLMERPAAFGASRQQIVIVNGVRLAPQVVRALEMRFRTRVPSGNYWYDRMSGLWGHRGGPTAGQMPPGLNLGGPLRADSSGGRTPVFINGRSLHPLEIRYLQQCVQVRPGRYWMNAAGIGGYVGGPPAWNLVALCQRAGVGGGGGGGSTWRSKTSGIGVSSQGNFVGVIGKGWSVITGP